MKKNTSLILIIIAVIIIPLATATGSGGTITTDGSYIIHTFLANSTFNWTGADTTAEILIVAGGGGGGSNSGGGGGAGGLIYNSSYTISAGTHNLIVGSGGFPQTVASSGFQGQNSSFDSLIAVGGGGGRWGGTENTSYNGGSGGGSAYNDAGGTGITGQGFNGGTASSGGSGYGASGGGGANNTGKGGTSTTAGNGGGGLNFSINGSIVCYAAGGGGGINNGFTYSTGGSCAGGTETGGAGGSIGQQGQNATAYGGGGGGEGHGVLKGGYGKQGIIIIKYLNTTTTPYSVSFSDPTTAEGIYFNNTQNNIFANITVTGMIGTGNSTIYLYNTSGLYASITNTTSTNFTYNFTGLPAATYYLNASATNGTITTAATKTITIYSERISFINPSTDGTAGTEYFNLSFEPIITPVGAVTISNYTISLLNNDTTINQTLNSSTTNTHQYFNLYNLNLSTGDYKFRIQSTDSEGVIINTTSPYISLEYNAIMNITAYSYLTSASIQNFTINITDRDTGITRSLNTTNFSIFADIKRNQNYTLRLDSEGMAITDKNITTNNQTYQNENISAYTENSINIRIFDESTNNIITENISITFNQGVSEITNTTTTGSYYQDGLTDGTWTVKFSGGNYTLKTYTITVADRSTQNLDAYLSANSESSIFTIMDFDSSSLIEGASFTQSKLINGSWTIINSKYSDITGRVQFDYIPNDKYQFLITATGYTNNLFYLDPVLFATYNIRMTKTVTLSPETTPDYTGVYITYYNNLTGDTTWINLEENLLIWSISSPIGSLETYNITVTMPGGTNLSRSGILAIGEELTQNFTLNSTNISDRVIISYCYKSTTSFNKCFKTPYPIIGVYLNTSMIANKDRTYGLGVFERILIITIAVLFVAGTIFIYGGVIPGLLVTLLIYGFSLSTGFVTIWMILPSLFIGFIIIATRRGGY